MSELEDRLNSILNNPEQMGKIADMAKSLMGEGRGESHEKKPAQNVEDAKSVLGGEADGEAFGQIGRILGELNGRDDDKTALLKAMEPYLSEKRRDKMDKAIKIARLAKIARIAMGEMGDKNV